MAILDSAMPVVIEAGTCGEIAKLSALKSRRLPVNLRHGAGPGLGLEYLRETLGELSIEGRIVGDHQSGRARKGSYFSRIYGLACDHGVIDASQCRNFRWD